MSFRLMDALAAYMDELDFFTIVGFIYDAFVDDILIYSKDEKENQDHL